MLHPRLHEVGRSGARYERRTAVDFLASPAPRPAVVDDGHHALALGPGWALLHYHSMRIDPAGARVNGALRSPPWTCAGNPGWQLLCHQGDAGEAATLPLS